MTGIISYKDLAYYCYWDQKFGYRDRGWYIIILGHLNPYQESPALKLILDQYTYLNRLTKDVRYFMPGFLIGEKGIIASRKYRHFDKFNFDEIGFLDTVEWLESSSNYEYSEDTEMVLLPYHITDQKSHEPICDFEHLQSYNLDTLLKEGVNLHKFIKEAVKVVHQNMTFDETKRLMSGVLENIKNIKTHKVFIAGSTILERERDGIRSILSQVSKKSDIDFLSWTFEEFERSFSPNGRQIDDYNSFIKEEADSIIFILNEGIGDKTKYEFDIAFNSYMSSKRPRIFVYNNSCLDEQLPPEIYDIKEKINLCNQYYTNYRDLKDLKQQVRQDYIDEFVIPSLNKSRRL